MAAISYNTIAEAIYEALKGKSADERSTIMPRVMQFLVRRRLISKSEEILARLQRIADREEGRLTAKISSTSPLSEPVKEKVRDTLKERYKVKDVALEEVRNEKLIGGFRIEIGDEVIDLSVRKKIQKLQEHLTQSA